MAQIDFTNAQLQLNTTTISRNQITKAMLDLLDRNNSTWYDANGNALNITSRQTLNHTASTVSQSFVGTVQSAGNNFGVLASGSSEPSWRIVGINYSAGDSFSFIIDLELTTS